MSRAKVLINDGNVREIYQYFAKALHEKRIFKHDTQTLTKARQAFLTVASAYDKKAESLEFKEILQEWIDTYVPQSKWQRCLATLRQLRSNQRHEVKSVKLNKETYMILKSYAEYLDLSLPQAIHQAIAPLLKELQVTQSAEDVSSILVPAVSNQHTIQLKLWLDVENNSKFVRGKKAVRENIELFCLSKYSAQQSEDNDWEYILTINYNNDEELDEIVHQIYSEMSSFADSRDCFIEADICTLDGEKSW